MTGIVEERKTIKRFKCECKNHDSINFNLVISPTINRRVKDATVDSEFIIRCLLEKCVHNKKYTMQKHYKRPK